MNAYYTNRCTVRVLKCTCLNISKLWCGIYFCVACSKCPNFFLQMVGEVMVDHNKLRNQLMDGAIKAVSIYGLEGLTTRSIEQQCKLKDSYIYRYFEDKEDLLKKAFLREDRSFINTIETNFSVMNNDNIDFKERCYSLWKPCWQYLVSRPDVCKFYVRYYYSTYFAQQALSEHTDICKMLVEKFADAFPKNVNVNKQNKEEEEYECLCLNLLKEFSRWGARFGVYFLFSFRYSCYPHLMRNLEHFTSSMYYWHYNGEIEYYNRDFESAVKNLQKNEILIQPNRTQNSFYECKMFGF